jgi:hypothetical protein
MLKSHTSFTLRAPDASGRVRIHSCNTPHYRAGSHAATAKDCRYHLVPCRLSALGARGEGGAR